MKAWIAQDDGLVLSSFSAPTPVLRRKRNRVEVDPNLLWKVICSLVTACIEKAPIEGAEIAGITATSLRQGFFLVGDDAELGLGVLNSDTRGSAELSTLRERIGSATLYSITGHWLAPELTLPKLMSIERTEPERWASTETVLFIHDWILWRLSGRRFSEITHISAGQLADVAERGWAWELLDEVGLDANKFAPSIEPGSIVGAVTRSAAAQIPGLVAGTPVVSGGGDTQFAAMGMGGLAPNTVTVVVGSSTPIQVATESPLRDPKQGPWVSAHLDSTLWAAETNAGYPGMMSGWLREIIGTETSLEGGNPVDYNADLIALVAAPHWAEKFWASRMPNTLIGFTPATTRAELSSAFLVSHAFAIRSNIEDLSQAMPDEQLRILVGGGASKALSRLLPEVLNRPVEFASTEMPAAIAGSRLVERALGMTGDPLSPRTTARAPEELGVWNERYSDYLDTHARMHDSLSEQSNDQSSAARNGEK